MRSNKNNRVRTDVISDLILPYGEEYIKHRA